MRAECTTFELEVEPGVAVVGTLDRPTESSGTDGPQVLVYLHGFGSSRQGEKADFFRARSLDCGLAFCAFDFRGHGESGGDMRGLSLGRCLDDVETVTQFLAGEGWGDLLLLGSSMGGLVGLWHAARHPARIAAQFHIAPAIGLAESFEALLGPEGVDQWRRRGVVEVTNELGTFEVGWGFAEDMERHPTEDLAALSKAAAVPAFLFQGKLDDRVDWRRVRAFAEAAGESVSCQLFDDGDHRLLELKGRIWETIEGFLAPAVATPRPRQRTRCG